MQVAETIASDIATPSSEPLGLSPIDGAELKDFFARPTRVTTLTFSTAGVANSYDIFSFWRNMPAVKEKLSRYGYFKGDLVVNFVVNGNPYQYGAIVCALRPMPIDVSNASNFDWANNRTQLFLGPLTGVGSAQMYQLPHVVINPGAEANMEISAPLMSTAQWIPLIGSLKPPIVLYTAVTSLANASGAAITPVTVSVYVHVRNAEVSMPVIQAQSGTREQRRDGVLYGVASAARSLALSLEPLLPAYATPAAAIAKMGMDIAAKFGWSRPAAPEIDPAVVVENNLALAVGGRLALQHVGVDPLRAVAVDAATCGYGSDGETQLTHLHPVGATWVRSTSRLPMSPVMLLGLITLMLLPCPLGLIPAHPQLTVFGPPP